MSVATTPPADLSPRVHSLDPADFAVPTSRDEEWRFSAFARLSACFTLDPSAGSVVAAPAAGVSVVPMSEVVSSWVPSDLPSAIARRGADRAVVIEIPAQDQVQEPFVVDLTATSATAYQHVEIVAGHFSRATVVLRQRLTGDVSGAIVANVGDGAELNIVTVIDGSLDAAYAMQMPVTLGRDSSFTSTLATLGGGAVRIVSSVDYRAPGGRANLLGAFLSDAGQHIEHRVFVNHEQPHCTSNVLCKGALMNATARSAWIGDVLVHTSAIGTDTYQMNRNLILSEGARADSVPNLELETGDIARAGHASATGRFDDEQVFYLQSRGLSLEQARQLVVRGFFAEVLSDISAAPWRDELLTLISTRLGIEAPEDEDE
ncbi:MAG: SufD family Fe-S cluster assembly protein [Candidatus Nanopelagicales bacterium]|nr:SufD family Fe-S cluster assembly protein [Candidatus Nanopelagicales bacterium]